MIVANTSPLIILGKTGDLDILRRCFGQCSIPKAVYQEILVRPESIEAVALQQAVKEKAIRIEKVLIHPMLHAVPIDDAEKEAISLAHKHHALLIIDDRSARQYADVLGVEVAGTVGVLLDAFRKNKIIEEEAEDILNAMVMHNFYISTQLFGIVLQEIRKRKR